MRPHRLQDSSAIYQAVMVSLKELSPWMEWATPDYSIEVTKAWLENLPNQWEKKTLFDLGLFNPSTGEFLGTCVINRVSWYYKMGNLAYWMRSDRSGRGLATTAVDAAARFGFQVLGLRRLEIVTALDNTASRRVAEKVGATFEGVMRNRINRGSNNIDAAMYSLIPQDHQGKR